jgi:hypothetical protein
MDEVIFYLKLNLDLKCNFGEVLDKIRCRFESKFSRNVKSDSWRLSMFKSLQIYTKICSKCTEELFKAKNTFKIQ